MMERQDKKLSCINTSILLKLPFYDPPKWGWAAVGGVADLLPPIEVSHKKNQVMNLP